MKIAVVAGASFFVMASAGALWPATKLNIHTEIVINAPPERVWSVLADNKSYGQWNPYHVRVEGDLVKGSSLRVELSKPDGTIVKIKPHVITVIPNKRLDWGGGIPGLFKGVHVFELHSSGKGCTRLVQRETFAGIFVGFAKLDGIEEGYNRMNQALKTRVEMGVEAASC